MTTSAIRFAAVFAAAAVLAPGMAAADYFDGFARSQELKENEARGGPKIVGANSPFMERIRVCQNLPLTTRDKATGQTTTVSVKRCWFEE
ncbi:MAG: hypothetical protein JJ902_14120 [Roseibium sp.]|nr:hypothetical protein [Roseibium sp.]